MTVEPKGATASFVSDADDLLKGAIDIHHHSYPEIRLDLRMRMDDAATLADARDAGMAGIVLKSHLWPTMSKAYVLNQQVPGITAYPSLTLNPIAGGFSPMAIESAARQGAKFLFMPTWSAEHDRERGGFSKHLAHLLDRNETLGQGKGVRVTEPDGRLRGDVDECLAVAGQYNLAIGTGHISPRESLAVAVGAKKHGIQEIFFQHPDSNSVKATPDEIREIAAAGAVIELCALGLLPIMQRIPPSWMMEMLQAYGPEKCVLTTDAFFDWAPPTTETLRMCAAILLSLGAGKAALRTIMRDVPRRLLHLPPIMGEPATPQPRAS